MYPHYDKNRSLTENEIRFKLEIGQCCGKAATASNGGLAQVGHYSLENICGITSYATRGKCVKAPPAPSHGTLCAMPDSVWSANQTNTPKMTIFHKATLEKLQQIIKYIQGKRIKKIVLSN